MYAPFYKIYSSQSERIRGKLTEVIDLIKYHSDYLDKEQIEDINKIIQDAINENKIVVKK